jgi:hypothetical protein
VERGGRHPRLHLSVRVRPLVPPADAARLLLLVLLRDEPGAAGEPPCSG